MKARIQIIGDYEETSKTYSILLIASEDEVNNSSLLDGDEVNITQQQQPQPQ